MQFAIVLHIHYISMCCANVLGMEMCATETTDMRYIRHSQMHMYYI